MEEIVNNKFSVLIPTDSWEKMEDYYQFVQENKWTSWGSAESQTYQMPVPPPFYVYFYRDKVVRYKAECYEVRRQGEVDFKNLPSKYTIHRKPYKNEFLIRNLDKIIDKPLHEILLWNAPQKRITWDLRRVTYVINPY